MVVSKHTAGHKYKIRSSKLPLVAEAWAAADDLQLFDAVAFVVRHRISILLKYRSRELDLGTGEPLQRNLAESTVVVRVSNTTLSDIVQVLGGIFRHAYLFWMKLGCPWLLSAHTRRQQAVGESQRLTKNMRHP